MNLSLFEKIGTLFSYIFSSFIPVGLLIIFILILVLLILNLKYKNKSFDVIIIGIIAGTLFGIILSHSDYIEFCIRSFWKMILNFIYFPSPVFYFFLVVFMAGIVIYSIFNYKLNKNTKIFNYSFFVSIYFLFFLFVVRVTMNGIVLMDITNVYSDDVLLSIVQISNLLFGIWVMIIFFYKLYNFYKKKFD